MCEDEKHLGSEDEEYSEELLYKCTDDKGGDNMDAIMERPSTILESIEESLKQIKEHQEGKRQFRTLKESKALWKKWSEEVENESNR
jgi:hypothetical protein